jgi:hypothetical protein
MPPESLVLLSVVGLFEEESPPSEKTRPSEFLSWAELDLQGTDKRSRGNALSNIKKALHSRLDEIICKTHVRFTRDWDPKRVTTPQKLEIIRALDIKHEAVIDLITSIRNQYEHDYIVPEVRNQGLPARRPTLGRKKLRKL